MLFKPERGQGLNTACQAAWQQAAFCPAIRRKFTLTNYRTEQTADIRRVHTERTGVPFKISGGQAARIYKRSIVQFNLMLAVKFTRAAFAKLDEYNALFFSIASKMQRLRAFVYIRELM